MIHSVILRNLKDLSDLFEEAGISVDVDDKLFLEFSKRLAVNMKGTTNKAMAIAKTLVAFSREKR